MNFLEKPFVPTTRLQKVRDVTRMPRMPKDRHAWSSTER